MLSPAGIGCSRSSLSHLIFHEAMSHQTPQIIVQYPPRITYTFITACCSRRTFSTSIRRSQTNPNDRFSRSDFHGQGFTGVYEPGQPTGGPLGDASIYGVPKVTPRGLKDHLDQFVVGQERAKKVLSTAVYNHYQRIQEIQRREDEVEEYYRRQELQSHIMRHPVEGAYKLWTVNFNADVL